MYVYRIPEELMESGDHSKALVFGVILRLTSKDRKCFASNRYIAEKIGRKDVSVIREHIQKLKKEGWIAVDNPDSKLRVIHINPRKFPWVQTQPAEKTAGNPRKFPHRRNTSEDIYPPTPLHRGETVKKSPSPRPVDNSKPHTSKPESLKTIFSTIFTKP